MGRGIEKEKGEMTTMLTIYDVAKMLQLTPRTIQRFVAGKMIPKPVKLGHSIRWVSATIREWIADDCPSNGGEN